MAKDKYILLDNIDYLKYYSDELSSEYTPIALYDQIKANLGIKGIESIGILDYLSDKEINALIQEAYAFVDNVVSGFDEDNRELYYQIFGSKDINFVYATMNYMFKRFVIGCFKLIKGLEAIVERKNIIDLSYLHDGNPVNLCANRWQNGFFFPSDVSWKLLDCWDYLNKPPTSLLKIKEQNIDKLRQTKDYEFKDFINRIKIPLRNVRDFVRKLDQSLPPYSPRKKNLLFITPLYDLDFILSSQELKARYNIIIWDVDVDIRPKFLQRQPQSSFFSDQNQSKKTENSECKEFLRQFNFDNRILRKSTSINVRLNSFLTPLIKCFLETKLPCIVTYWRAAQELHNTTKIDMFFWGCPPHKYPGGIVNEFFRLKKVPIFGMQHGGICGSNDMGRTLFDLDLNRCDYYFSYGFDNRILSTTYPGERKLPEVIPAGSITISNFNKRYNLSRRYRKEVKVIFPIAITLDNIFMAPEFILPRLFNFQQKIINALADFRKFKIILKFPCGSYNGHYLKPYIEKYYPGAFQIVDNMSFQKCLELYDAQIIIIEQQSTPLNECLITKSNIFVYNDDIFIKLTEEAFTLLDKRAIICNTKEDFIRKIEDFLRGNIEPKDLENREFLKRYCIHNGSPEENIINAINND